MQEDRSRYFPEELKAKKTIGKTFSPEEIDKSILKTFPYEYTGKKIWVEHTTNEFTCLCPFNELPDYATLTIKYIPDKLCIELKSLKYYLYAYRGVKIFHEHAINKILEDLVSILHPIEMNIEGNFNIRGGISTKIIASYKKDDNNNRR